MTAATPKYDYLSCQRHILLDMHVPDFEEEFLRRFDPVRLADLYGRAGADAVMFYCNSMTGLCNWPTEVGRMHPGLDGRDVVAETVALLHDQGIAACAYYSVNFNSWAYHQHPDWQVKSANESNIFSGASSRSGVCCPANREFLEFAVRQVGELASTYDVDALFLDMLFWPDVCVCDACRERYRREENAELPVTIDWLSSEWCRFQSARERWLNEAFLALSAEVKRHRNIPVFCNSSIMAAGWRLGLNMPIMTGGDLVGGDVQAGLLPTYCHFAAATSRSVVQYMHAGSNYVSGKALIRPVHEQVAHADIAMLFGAQFMAIDAALPDGDVFAPTYDAFADVFDHMRPYADYLGGRPLADVGVYWSLSSNMDFRDNGKPVTDSAPPVFSPHVRAVQGACAALQRAHLAAGIITSADLDDLARYPVVVLPNVLRMDAREISAFRDYVQRGGHLYVSALTSLTDTAGSRNDDFMLADVLGCRFDAADAAAIAYISPSTEDLAAAIAPMATVPHGSMLSFTPPSDATTLRIHAVDGATVLATHTEPYGDGRGSKEAGWASIFSQPPWRATDRPLLVENTFGQGRVIYSACDIEIHDATNPGAQRLFVHLVRDLLDGRQRVEADAHPNVWMVAFDEPDAGRVRVNLLNHGGAEAPLPIPRIQLRLRPPAGTRFSELVRLPAGGPLDFVHAGDGLLTAEVVGLDGFVMLAARYEHIP